ncbi:hypothetical protein AMECASPLE_023242 [Ameca splendens]|uniref:Thioredoxin domain-containing protein n=1 Tax=Ameca splendens TaxID=208324 RepID=A0ABV1A2L5_9TELE
MMLSVINAWLIYRRNCKLLGVQKPLKQRSFQADVATSLILLQSQRGNPSQNISSPPPPTKRVRVGVPGAFAERKGVRESLADMVEVFSGRTLLNKDGEFVDPEEVLRNKVVGIYFSAGWCPPCRDFTPVLCDFYTELVEESETSAQFEIVFISSDKSLDDMVEYYHDMHGDWLALPWSDDYKQ